MSEDIPVPLDTLTTRQLLRAILTTLTRLEIRMATLEEVTLALTDAVDRVGTVLSDLTVSRDAARDAAAAAQQALDAANAADVTEDADYQAQIDSLTQALQAATDALAATSAAQEAAVASIQSNVDELNNLAPASAPAPTEPGPEPTA